MHAGGLCACIQVHTSPVFVGMSPVMLYLICTQAFTDLQVIMTLHSCYNHVTAIELQTLCAKMVCDAALDVGQIVCQDMFHRQRAVLCDHTTKLFKKHPYHQPCSGQSNISRCHTSRTMFVQRLKSCTISCPAVHAPHYLLCRSMLHYRRPHTRLPKGRTCHTAALSQQPRPHSFGQPQSQHSHRFCTHHPSQADLVLRQAAVPTQPHPVIHRCDLPACDSDTFPLLLVQKLLQNLAQPGGPAHSRPATNWALFLLHSTPSSVGGQNCSTGLGPGTCTPSAPTPVTSLSLVSGPCLPEHEGDSRGGSALAGCGRVGLLLPHPHIHQAGQLEDEGNSWGGSALAGCGGVRLLAHPHIHQAGQLAVGRVGPLRLAEQALHRHRKLQRLSSALPSLQNLSGRSQPCCKQSWSGKDKEKNQHKTGLLLAECARCVWLSRLSSGTGIFSA